jgi:hypothetical protein
MPSIPGRKPVYPRPEPDRIYKALTGYVGPEGPIPAGTRRRGSDPAVTASPKFWCLDGLLDSEEIAIFHQRFPDTPYR